MAAAEGVQDGSYGDAVHADEDRAARLGISGAPFGVIDGKYGVSGARPEETFVRALRDAWGSSSG